MLETDLQFNKDMSNVIDNLKRMPKYKDKVWEKVTNMHKQLGEERGTMGIEAGEIFVQRQKDKQRRAEREEVKCREQLILQTSKSSALQAINLSQLLKKKWSEEKNAYIIMSKVKNETQRTVYANCKNVPYTAVSRRKFRNG